MHTHMHTHNDLLGLIFFTLLCLALLFLFSRAQEELSALELLVDLAWRLWWRERRVLLLLCFDLRVQYVC